MAAREIMGFIQVFMLSAFAQAYVGVPIPVTSETYRSVNASATSCGLLTLRAKERAKVIREVQHLMGVHAEDHVRRFMEMNELMSNKLFLDKSVWQDDSVEVVLRAEASPALLDEIREQGLKETFFSLKATGVTWNARAFNFPEDFTIEVSPSGQHLDFRYQIYQSDYCLSEKTAAELSWIPNEVGEIDELIDSRRAVTRLRKLME